MGIQLQSGMRLGVDLALADLTSRFDAVFLGLGDPDFSRLGIDDEHAGADFVINTKCTGCGLCVRRCPVSCISGDKKELHVIDSTVCIRCGTCRRVCKFDAVDVVAGAASGSAGGEVAETAGGRCAPDADVAEVIMTMPTSGLFKQTIRKSLRVVTGRSVRRPWLTRSPKAKGRPGQSTPICAAMTSATWHAGSPSCRPRRSTRRWQRLATLIRASSV